jgi:hypothetical protein
MTIIRVNGKTFRNGSGDIGVWKTGGGQDMDVSGSQIMGVNFLHELTEVIKEKSMHKIGPAVRKGFEMGIQKLYTDMQAKEGIQRNGKTKVLMNRTDSAAVDVYMKDKTDKNKPWLLKERRAMARSLFRRNTMVTKKYTYYTSDPDSTTGRLMRNQSRYRRKKGATPTVGNVSFTMQEWRYQKAFNLVIENNSTSALFKPAGNFYIRRRGGMKNYLSQADPNTGLVQGEITGVEYAAFWGIKFAREILRSKK